MCIEFQHLRGQEFVIKGLAYLLTYFKFLENSENDSKLKDWINFAIYWKNLLSHSRPWPWPWLTGLSLGLDTSGLVKIPGFLSHIRGTFQFFTQMACT